MARTLSAPRIDQDLQTRSAPIEPPAEDPFRVALLGDFGGRASRNEPRLRRDPIQVTARNFEKVMALLGASLDFGDDSFPGFRELEDFHPDRLYHSLAVFQTLRDSRRKLADPAPRPRTASAPADGGDPFEQAIRGIVAPHLIPDPDPMQVVALAELDEAISGVMRTTLRDRHFQDLEAAWRSVFFLLQRMKTTDELKLYLIDITRQEIDEAARSGHPQLIARDGWSAAACLHSFGPSEEDCATLACLAGLARKCGGPLIAGMDPLLLGCRSIAATPDPDDWTDPPDAAFLRSWAQLRSHPDAQWLGLAMPRLLLRVPYGAATSPVESFVFEEMPDPSDHEAYLWASPAVGCIGLLGQGFHARGWEMHPGLKHQIDGLPVHNYYREGEPRMTPAAETWLTDYAAEKILEMGVMSLTSSQTTAAVSLVRSQSVADPPCPLAGPWLR